MGPGKLCGGWSCQRDGARPDGAAGAAALLHAIAEKEHDIADGTLAFGTAESRAGALITWLKRRQSATTPEARVKAENHIRAALFAEAAPGNRLASFGLAIAPIIANLRAAEDFTEDTQRAAKALREGRYNDAAGASLWAVIDLAGAVTGFGAAGKGLKSAVRQSKIGRKAFAARDLARMARDFHRSRNVAPARALVGEKVWKMLDEDQRGYLEGLYSNVKGQAAEGALTDTLEDLGLNTAKVLERRSRLENPKIPVRRNSMLESEMLEEHGGRTRIFDDAIDGYGLEKSPFGLALFAKPIRGRQQKFEMKSADAELSAKQKADDANLMDSAEDYGDIDVAYLALPYDKLPKKALREIAVGLMRNPERAGQKYITTGRWKIVARKDAHKYPVVRKFKGKDGKEKIVRLVKWKPEDLEMMIQQVDRNLRLQHLRDQAPTVIDFTLALFARLAIEGRDPNS